VAKFASSRPFPLGLEQCQSAGDLERFVLGVLKSFGGIRRGQTIARQISGNFKHLEGGRWELLLDQIRCLKKSSSPAEERNVARFLDAELVGLGPKQARNTLQLLGLTRHETPIDSRVTKWLTSFGFPLPLSAASLSDQGLYEFVADGFQALCKAAGILPCLIDAAIFASFDKPSA
jgi:hypothetical protein